MVAPVSGIVMTPLEEEGLWCFTMIWYVSSVSQVGVVCAAWTVFLAHIFQSFCYTKHYRDSYLSLGGTLILSHDKVRQISPTITPTSVLWSPSWHVATGTHRSQIYNYGHDTKTVTHQTRHHKPTTEDATRFSAILAENTLPHQKPRWNHKPNNPPGHNARVWQPRKHRVTIILKQTRLTNWTQRAQYKPTQRIRVSACI